MCICPHNLCNVCLFQLAEDLDTPFKAAGGELAEKTGGSDTHTLKDFHNNRFYGLTDGTVKCFHYLLTHFVVIY